MRPTTTSRARTRRNVSATIVGVLGAVAILGLLGVAAVRGDGATRPSVQAAEVLRGSDLADTTDDAGTRTGGNGTSADGTGDDAAEAPGRMAISADGARQVGDDDAAESPGGVPLAVDRGAEAQLRGSDAFTGASGTAPLSDNPAARLDDAGGRGDRPGNGTSDAEARAGSPGAEVRDGGARTSGPGTPVDDPGPGAGRASGLAGGALPDGVTVFDDGYPGVARLAPGLLLALREAASDAADEGIEFHVTSGWRAPEYQNRLLREAVAQYGSAAEAARWVATVDTSAHVSGNAADIGGSDALTWLSAHGARYGLCQIYDNEPWHYELRREAAGGACPRTYADPTHDPRMSSSAVILAVGACAVRPRPAHGRRTARRRRGGKADRPQPDGSAGRAASRAWFHGLKNPGPALCARFGGLRDPDPGSEGVLSPQNRARDGMEPRLSP